MRYRFGRTENRGIFPKKTAYCQYSDERIFKDMRTDELIKSITETEEQAAQMRRVALEKAAELISQAENRGQELITRSIEDGKLYRETEQKKAFKDAEREYASAMKVAEDSAKEYCQKVTSSIETVVQEIVGRIVNGNC